jgi:hypothetical protein
MLDKDEKQSGSIHNTNVPASQDILRVVPVQIMAATVMNTFDLCDEASTTTLIDASFAKQIGADCPELVFCCRWMNKITKNYEKSKKVTFKVAGIGSESKWHVEQTIDVYFLMKLLKTLTRSTPRTWGSCPIDQNYSTFLIFLSRTWNKPGKMRLVFDVY